MNQFNGHARKHCSDRIDHAHDGGDLPNRILDQARAVSAAHVEAVVTPKQPAPITDPDQSFVELCINHEDAGRCDDDVVDVASCSCYSSIAQYVNALDTFESLRQLLLPD